MQYSILALAGLAALVSAQSYTGALVSPTAAAPVGCATSYSGTFELSVTNATNSKAKAKRVEPNALVISLKDGVLTDNQGRLGYIANNYQFQFDFGGQAGEIYNSGFSICGNKSLALGGSAVWYECLSGTFYNIYDVNWAPQCKAAFLEVIPMSASPSMTTVAGTAAGTAAIATTTTEAAVGQTTDGQATAGTATTPVTSSVVVVTSATTSTTSEAVVTSISDNQPQAPTTTSAVVTAMTSVTSLAIVTSITDHQIQGPTATSAVTVTPYTGAASMPTMAAQMLLAAAGAAVALF